MMTLPSLQLLAGTHPDTGVTGQGCFMNVIAYLNGENQITDQSPCVCPIIRPKAIWLNDYCNDEQRQRLLPFILRVMGSVTTDKTEITRRVNLVVKFANLQKKLAAESAESSAKSAAMKEKIIQAEFDFLDEASPPFTLANESVIEKVRTLASLAT